MRRIIVKNKQQNKTISFFDSKSKLITTGIIAVIILIITGIFMFMEENDSKIVITNKTDLKLEYVKAYFVGPEERYNEGINQTDIVTNQTIVIPQEPINLVNSAANLEVRFKFEGYEQLFVDSGIFNDEFSGKITIDYVPTDDGKINLKVKAKSGIVSSNLIDCDEEFIINLSEGYVEE